MSLLEIKSLQYVLIVKAGLAVTEGPEKSIERLQSDVIIEYNLAVTNVKLPTNLKHIDRSCLIRSKNQLAPKNKVSAGDMHTGSSIWRKYNEIRRYVINDISFAYSRKILVVNHCLGKITMKF